MAILAILCLPACGPKVSDIKQAHYPAKPEDCELTLLRTAPMAEMGNTGKWETVGFVVLQQQGVQDPFADDDRTLVRASACRMGGEAVTVMQAAVMNGRASRA